MTSTGQISAHSPQPVQAAVTTSDRSPPAPGRIACSGHVSRHAPHPWHAPIHATALAGGIAGGIAGIGGAAAGGAVMAPTGNPAA